ncbi:proline--tRNA ligase [Alphaproteobacteria bacterium]|nr:proline--tRNA ligase [Alphaproteobacteria bacterium]
MKLTDYFLPLKKEKPKEAEITSHILMLRSGMCQQSSSGIYSWLPLGKKVLDKIEKITKDEMNASGAIEILMPTIQPAELWIESNRYQDYGKEMLRIKDRNNKDLLYGPTNEELITDIFRNNVQSYKNLPLNLYHVQWKFRDEVRPRFGVMRGREFLMKDAYSFDISKDNAKKSYNKMFVAYMKLFKKMGLSPIAMKAETGPIGGDLSHEFIIISKTGESNVFFDESLLDMQKIFDEIDYNDDLQECINKYTSFYSATDEMHNPRENQNTYGKLIKTKGIEVGHIFHFGQKYSKPLNATIANEKGQILPVFMGSYGVGISRLVGGIIEANHDENGIIWPKEVSPFKCSLINLNSNSEECQKVSSQIYNYCNKKKIDVLLDNTRESIGSKLTTANLIGFPYQVIIGPKGIKNNSFEIKIRKTNETKNLSLNEIFNFINENMD